MAELTPRLGLYKPADDGSEPLNVATDLNDNLEKLDAQVGAVPATTNTAPTNVFDGMLRQNTDDQSLEYFRNNTTWTQIWSKGASFASDALIALGNKIGIGTLTPGAILDAITGSASDIFARLRVTGDTQPRVQIESTGIRLGPGGATATDVRLYRQNAGTLNITGNVVLENNLQVSGTPSFSGGVNITGATVVDGDANMTGGIDVEDHITFEGYPIMVGQRGTTSISVTNGTSGTIAVTFGRTYPSAPNVVCNITSSSGTTTGWGVRAINITTTGFTAFVFGSTTTFTGMGIQWVAVHEGL